MSGRVHPRRHYSVQGFSLTELVVVTAIMGILGAVSVQQIAASRKLIRSAAVTREIVSALRDARQMAISERRAITFQYDDSNKQITIINHGADAQGVGVSGISVLTASGYPNTTGSSVERTYSLASTGIPATDIKYGMPSGAATGASTLGDNTTLTSLSSQKLYVTFQPDGTVVNSTGNTRDVALFIYNATKPIDTAMAVSILGGTGRIKSWRYSNGASKYVE